MSLIAYVFFDQTEGYIEIDPSSSLRISEKKCQNEWNVTITCPSPLSDVALLHDTHRQYFSLLSVERVHPETERAVNNTTANKSSAALSKADQKKKSLEESVELGIQEWKNSNLSSEKEEKVRLGINSFVYVVCVLFKSNVYGTFRQGLVFDFDEKPILMERFCVDVYPIEERTSTDVSKDKAVVVKREERWSDSNVHIIRHESRNDSEDHLMEAYPPKNVNSVLAHALIDGALTIDNYRSRFHDLLCMEEASQFDLMSRFNIRTTVLCTKSYTLSPSTTSMSKFAPPGSIFIRLELSSNISEDSPHGRLILTNCNAILISGIDESEEESSPSNERRIVYELPIEDKTKKEIYLKLSCRIAEQLGLVAEEEGLVEVQFQLNR